MSATAKLTGSRTLAITENRVLVQAFWIAFFAAATALSARFEIPHQPVPYTLQTLVVLLAGAFLGARNGAISQVLYLAAGIAGLPVFAGGAFGLWKLFGPTGGYLLAFPVAAAVVGVLTQKNSSILWSVVAMFAGLLVIFASGTAQLYAVYFHDLRAAISSGFLIFSWWDVLKLSAGAMIYHELAKRWPRLPA
jgi:biotin transport system substrate-specific component